MKREEKKILTKGSILTKCKVKKRSGQSDALIYPFDIIHLKTLSLMQNKTSYKNRCKTAYNSPDNSPILKGGNT